MTTLTTSDVDRENKQMLQITEQLADGRRYVHDLHNLKLPSGIYAHQLGQPDLYRELVAHNIPGIENWMGHQQLSILFSRWAKDQEPKQ